MKDNKIRFIVEVGINSSLATVFDFLAVLMFMAFWPNGGSISIACIPILIAGYRWGLKGGILTGIITGLVQMIWIGSFGGYLTFFQALIEYPIAYLLIGLATFNYEKVREEVGFKKFINIFIPLLICFTLKTILHIVCGVFYWKINLVGSIIYNTPYSLISFLLVLVLTYLIISKNIIHLDDK